MRRTALLLIASGLASCTTAPASPTRSAQSQAELQSLIAGKVAQAPVNAQMLRQLLEQKGLPVTPAPAAA